MSDTKRKRDNAPAGVGETVRLNYGSNAARSSKVGRGSEPAKPTGPSLPGGLLAASALDDLADELLTLVLLRMELDHSVRPSELAVLSAHAAALGDYTARVAHAEATEARGDGLVAAREVLAVCEALVSRLPALAASLARVRGDVTLAHVTGLRRAAQQARVDLLIELQLFTESAG